MNAKDFVTNTVTPLHEAQAGFTFGGPIGRMRHGSRPRCSPKRTNLRTFGYDPPLMIAIMWQFDVKDGREEEFEKLYGADGDWTALNRQTRSYLGSSFLRDQNQSSRYLLIEYWSEMIVYEQHRTSRSALIKSVEARRAELVEVMEPLGIYTALDVPDRWGPTWSQRR